MIEITDEEWELLKQYFGDLAYEEPHNHERYLAYIRGLQEIEAGEVEDMDDVLADMDAIIASGEITNHEVLEQYSAGKMSSRVACIKLGLRDNADLLVALGDAGLPMPQPSEAEVAEQASTFAALFRENKEAKREAALEILDRAPDVPPDPGDELPE